MTDKVAGPDGSELSEGLGPLVDSEEDPARLWAEIHRLRAAMQGPAGYATWQDAAIAERVRRVRAENEAGAHAQSLRVSREHIAAGLVAAEADRDMLRDALAALEAAVSDLPCELGKTSWHALEDARQALAQAGGPNVI